MSLATTTATTAKFDTRHLTSSQLLQSIYAETLRKYVAVIMVRRTTTESKLGAWRIPKEQNVVVCSYSAHMDDNNWNAGPADDPHPVSEFWGKRFLQESKDGPKFSLAGMEGKWLPYGMGERMCPGRHFAKHQMMMTFAYLMSTFDIELIGDKSRPVVDLNHFGFGTLPPGELVPFRMRRAAKTVS
jgi:cytochrome P450